MVGCFPDSHFVVVYTSMLPQNFRSAQKHNKERNPGYKIVPPIFYVF